MATTFSHPHLPVAHVGRALADLGLEVGGRRRRSRTVLDSFDGRLHAAGLRLVLERAVAGAGLLVLRDRDHGGAADAARLEVDTAPRLAADLPPGPFRLRVAAAVGDRALLPLVTVTADATGARRRDRRRKATVDVDLFGPPSVAGADDPGLGGTFVEVTASPGHDDDAAAIGRSLLAIGFVPVDGDLVALASAAAGIDLGGRPSSATVPLDRSEPAGDGFRRVLRNLADTVEANRPGVVGDVDAEFLHDLRIAVRRTRSLLSRARDVLPEDGRRGFADGFRWLGDVTSPVRDLDVMLSEWPGYLEPLPAEVARALGPVRCEVERRRHAAQAQLADHLRSDRYETLMAGWTRWLEQEPPPPRRGLDPIGVVVGERIVRAQRRLVRHGRAITPASPAESLHDLRKDAKKLRYLVECFGSLFDDGPRRRFVRRLKALQDNLGEHQDTEVHVAQLRALVTELHATTRLGADALLATGRLTGHLEARRRAARLSFGERFTSYDVDATARALDDLLGTAST